MCWWGDGVAGVDKPNVLVGRWGSWAWINPMCWWGDGVAGGGGG